MKKNFNSIDIAKFAFSILILCMHADAFSEINPILNTVVCHGIARLGVPFFFVASSYFLFSKPLTKASVQRYCKRLLVLYLAWFIVSIPKTVFDRFICSGDSFGRTLFRFIRSFFVTSTFSGSWFITACIFNAILFYLLRNLSHKKYVMVVGCLSVVSYVWCVFSSAYGNLIDVLGLTRLYKGYVFLFANPYNSIIVGIPYFALGKVFAEHEKILAVTVTKAIGAVVCVTFLCAELYFVTSCGLLRQTDCSFFLLPCIYFLFPLILNWEVSLKHASWYRIASTIIFFSQFWLLFVCEIAEWILKITIPCFGKFSFALAGGLALTAFILAMSDKPRWKWLKYFY